MAVDTPNLQYEAMSSAGAWDLCQALLAGTPGMRAAGKAYLPKEPAEKEKNYKVRLGRSFLYNAYKNTIEKYISRPFSRPATWDIKNNEDAKNALEPVMNDMDGEGLHHQDFSKEYFRMLMRWGVSSAYVDYPEVDDPESTNKGQEQANGLRPINRVLKTVSIIGWKTEEQANGTEKLSEIRIKEAYVSDGADWTQTLYEQIRVITATEWKLYRREKKANSRNKEQEEYTLSDEGEIRIAGEDSDDLPVVTAYTYKTGMMTALPPFLEMAWTNLELWMSSSDQKNILRFDRLGILFGKGLTDNEKKAGITIAPTSATLTENPDAGLERVETNGQPAENGWKDIRDIMERLEAQGMDPMIQRMANVKATGLNINETNSRSQVESWIDAANIAMRKILQLNLAWMGFDIPIDDIEYQINQDFVFATKTAQEVTALQKMRDNGDIGQVDYTKEMQRYGIIADGNAVEIAARARADRGTGLDFPGAPGIPTPQTNELGSASIGDASREEVVIGVTP